MYHEVDARQLGVPTFELNVAWMSEFAVSKSRFPSMLASAIGYQVFGFGKVALATADSGPAEPKTPEVAVHDNGRKLELILISMLSCSVAPHTCAAVMNTIKACWPLVVPLLPPIGVAGVGSLKPMPGASVLTMVMVAACAVLPRVAA